MTEMRPRYSIVAPVFNEEETLPEFYRRTCAIMDGLDGTVELILVFDGSRDRSPRDRTRSAGTRPPRQDRPILRNFGHQIAITAGIDYAEGDAVVLIDSDLQDPPEVIPQFDRALERGVPDRLRSARAAQRGDVLSSSLRPRSFTSSFAALLP